MKNSKKNLYSILILCFVLALSSFGLFYIQKNNDKKVSTTSTETEETKQTEKETSEKSINFSTDQIDSSIKKPILNYYAVFFDALSGLKSENIGELFYNGDSGSVNAAMFDQTFLDTTIAIRDRQPTDLTMKDYAVDLDLVSVDWISPHQVEVKVRENQDVVFNESPETHSLSTIENTFELAYLNDQWQIIDHERDADVYVLMDEIYSDRYWDKTDYDQRLKGIQNELITAAEKNIAEQNRDRENLKTTEIDKRDDRSYNREAAVAYANQYALVRNPEYIAYDEVGGNCNNFISQAILAGGVITDDSGSNVWYYNDGDATASWTNVDYFYDYATHNTGKGFRAIATDNLYSGQIGDIIQYGVDGDYRHSVIITDLIKDEDGNTIDYLISSNTTDRQNFPASAYGYSQFRLIKIYGNADQ